MFRTYKGAEIMSEQLAIKQDELREKMKKYDEALLKLIKQGPIEVISKIITDYLSSLE